MVTPRGGWGGGLPGSAQGCAQVQLGGCAQVQLGGGSGPPREWWMVKTRARPPSARGASPIALWVQVFYYSRAPRRPWSTMAAEGSVE